jgi:TonB-linked SusC/RagA family outer membrane protein
MGSRRMRLGLLALAVIGTTVAGRTLSAQAPGTVRGRIVEAGSGRGMSNVQIQVVGSIRGALSGINGEYVVSGVPSGRQTIRARMIAYSPSEQNVEVTAQGTATADFVLAPAAITLDEVVVTGVPGTSKRTLGNAITTIDAADVTQKVSNVNVTELLQAKAPGLSIMPGGGSPGTGSTIHLRGIGSLNASATPVIYIDGVRLQSGPQGSFWNSWRTQRPGEPSAGAGQEAIALDMLSPEDIESIEIIKGPAAATLYGADAASGVIQVITKRGRPGDQRLAWNAKAVYGKSSWAVDRVTNYTTCTPAIVASVLDDGVTKRFPGCQGKTATTILSRTPLDDPGALRNGTVDNYSINVRGGGQGYSYFATGDRDDEQGVMANSMNSRTGARANFAFFPNERLDFAVNVGYNKLHTQFPINDDGYGVIQGAVTWRPGYYVNTTDPTAKCPTEGFAGPGPACVYSWWNNHLRSNRMTIGTTVNYRPFAWLKNRLTVGLDQNDRITDKYVPPGSIYGGADGEADRGAPSTALYTVDYSATAASGIPRFHTLSSAFSVGAQYASSQYRNTVATGSGFASGTIDQVALAAATQSFTEFVDQKSLGLYGQEQIGWRDRLFLTGAVRVDNNSAFGSDINWLAYPKISASYILSEEPFFHRFAKLDQLKLRVAWGQAGNVPAPFAGQRSFTSGATIDDNGRRVPALLTGQYGNPDIKPERGVEVEGGLDASFLKNRLGAELTYYNKKTRDALMAVPVPPSTGFLGSVLQNLGEIKNTGFELALTATPVQRRVVNWESRLGVSTNHNELVSFGYDRTAIILSLYQPVQRHQPGYPLGGYWGNFPARDASGKLVVNTAGALVAEDSQRYIGPATPTREASFGNTLTFFGNLRLFGLLDYKGGHYLYNVKDQYRCWGGSFVTTWSTNAAQNIPGACWDVNDPSQSEEFKRMRQQDPSINNGLFIQKADFIKLRDVSLTYTLPSSWVHRTGTEQAAITFAVHNAAILWKPHYSGPDPEVNFTGVNDPGSYFSFIRVDSWTAPMTRRFTTSLQLSF